MGHGRVRCRRCVHGVRPTMARNSLVYALDLGLATGPQPSCSGHGRPGRRRQPRVGAAAVAGDVLGPRGPGRSWSSTTATTRTPARSSPHQRRADRPPAYGDGRTWQVSPATPSPPCAGECGAVPRSSRARRSARCARGPAHAGGTCGAQRRASFERAHVQVAVVEIALEPRHLPVQEATVLADRVAAHGRLPSLDPLAQEGDGPGLPRRRPSTPSSSTRRHRPDLPCWLRFHSSIDSSADSGWAMPTRPSASTLSSSR